jgi:hypothetical protein
LGYFTHRYGKIDRIDSQNEYWLETEAKLRTDFNIPGIKIEQTNQVKRKSLMKEVFVNHKILVAKGRSSTRLLKHKFLDEVDAVVAKPDIGVGAAKLIK